MSSFIRVSEKNETFLSDVQKVSYSNKKLSYGFF